MVKTQNGGFFSINLTSRRFQSHNTDNDILKKYRIFNASSKPMYMIAKVTFSKSLVILRERSLSSQALDEI